MEITYGQSICLHRNGYDPNRRDDFGTMLCHFPFEPRRGPLAGCARRIAPHLGRYARGRFRVSCGNYPSSPDLQMLRFLLAE